MLFPEKYYIFGKSIIGGTVKKLRTDRQTLNDLGIVESTYGEKTLFSLFDMTESIARKAGSDPLSGLSGDTYL
ncbi:hypothetical protein DWW29_01920 [Bacteroides fragilis]|nr:hypothetical protein DWW29_01920 [Bacteroides fragilis]